METKIKQLEKLFGSQKQTAKILGVTPTQLQRLKKGTRQPGGSIKKLIDVIILLQEDC